MKNTQVNAGGLGAHTARGQLLAMHEAGVRMICVSPIKDDVGTLTGPSHYPIFPLGIFAR